MKTSLLALTLLTASCATILGQTYTFTLSDGILNGRDNWTDFNEGGVSQYQVVGNRGTGLAGLVSRTARINDANFSFATFTGAETAAIVQFDVTVPANSGGGNKTSLFSLGTDSIADPDALFDQFNEIAFEFGIFAPNWGSASFSINSNEALVPLTEDAGDTLQLQLRLDFTANALNGSGSLFYRNLTDGDIAFTAVAGLQNINMAFLAKLSDVGNPANWDGMAVRGDINVVFADNLTTVVPEPTSAALLLGSGLVLLARRGRPATD